MKHLDTQAASISKCPNLHLASLDATMSQCLSAHSGILFNVQERKTYKLDIKLKKTDKQYWTGHNLKARKGPELNNNVMTNKQIKDWLETLRANV